MDTGPNVKVKFTIGMLTFMLGAYAVPFAAAKFSIHKNGRETVW